ncbi:sulfotransferase family protein [Aureimonas psammosilenae]|uniref:sulfotransferase family protein n=1 Tax=Aureimonas psammosilenae TaxID=2495496 RepID=UPI0012611FA6|nr:hypothetical protein [Aureimonas psammosilenae]
MQHHDDSAARAIAILVLGMHRSGTSAVTGVLDRLGIPAAGELLPAESYNAKGIYENKAVNLFHNRLLAHLGSRWDDPMPVSNAFVETPTGQGFVVELAGIIETELLAKTDIFAVKDPRMCRFIPLWKAALDRLGAEPRAIVPLRHPIEVAGSLGARDKFPRAKSFLLWLIHALAVERETRGVKRSFVSYDALLSDWRGCTERFGAELDLQWPKERARVENEIDEFLSRDLRHHETHGPIGEGTRLDALVERSWEALGLLVGNETDAQAQDALDAVWAELEAASSVLAPYVAWEFGALGQALERVNYLEELEKVLRAQNLEYFEGIAEARAEGEAERERLEVSHQRALAHETAALRRQAAEEATRLRGEIADLRRTADKVGWLEGETGRLHSLLHQEQVALAAMRASTFWRLTGPARHIAGAFPPSAKAWLRRSAKAGWWAATPWRMPQRMQFLRDREAAALAVSSPQAIFAPTVGTASAPARSASDTQRPLQLFAVKDSAPRLSMVTDSINAGSLFGGVATALIFSTLLARKTGRRLRIITRTQSPDAGNVATVFRAHGIDWDSNIEFAFANTHDPSSEIDTSPDELFVTTSWWSTQATRASVPAGNIVYLLQEDERMFYAMGNDNLACAEVMADRAIRKVVNSELLHRHLAQDGIVGDETPFFEPSFPERIYHPAPRPEGEKRNFFFYARPNNERNLYGRGVAVIEAAIERGILDPAVWDIHFVGKDLKPMMLTGGVEPILLQNLAWEDYAAYVRSVDLALTLMYTPHPSYPPLDVAACGGVAVTNRFGVKTDLSRYSQSIICADSEVASLVAGLEAGVRRATNSQARQRDSADNRILRDWNVSFGPVLARLVEDTDLVR